MTDPTDLKDGVIDAGPQEEAQPRTMPLSQLTGGGDGFPGTEQFDMELGRRGLPVPSQGVLLVILVLAVTAGVIYGMRAAQGDIAPGSASLDAEAKIDQALVKLDSATGSGANDPADSLYALFGDADQIAGMFENDMTDHQVPIEFLHRNPFVQAAAPVSADKPQKTGKTASAADRRQQQRNAFEQQIGRLSLQTVIMGRVNVAVIDDDLVQEGQKVGDFIVRKIGKHSVELEAGGETFTLRMSE